jgi:oligogalacturonide lyase
MSAGQSWPAEWAEDDDPVSGVRVKQLTNYKGHSHHLYFTNPGWWDRGRRLLFGSDRENRTNLFSIHLATGEITQLTDLEPLAPPDRVAFQHACVNPSRAEAYFWYGREIVALDLRSLDTRTIFSRPRGFRGSMLNCTADARYVCTSYFEDLGKRFRIAYNQGYIGFPETYEAHPLSRIIRVETDGTGGEIVREEKTWIGHVNTSPTQPQLLTFCHEGPWHLVDNRIWGMDVQTGRAWPIRARQGNEVVGHEYWHADGLHLGYHGSWPDGRRFFGMVRYDDTGRREVDFPHETGHIHSNDFSMIVGDGGQVVRLWRWDGQRFDGPRALCEHRSSSHIQEVHVHPRFTSDGKQVLFTSDRTGYGNVYLADIEEYDTLPEVQ